MNDHTYMSDGSVLCQDGLSDALPATAIDTGQLWVIGKTNAPCDCHMNADPEAYGLPSIPLNERQALTV